MKSPPGVLHFFYYLLLDDLFPVMSFVDLPNADDFVIAIVDDDPRVRLVLQATLQDLNVSPVIFDNAFDLLRALKQVKPSCVFLDFILPQMTGLECVRSLRDQGYSEQVFIFSSLYDSELREQSLDAGADDFFLKADFLKDLPSIVKRVMKAR